MQLSLRPGFVYILHSARRPQEVKVGKATLVEAREFQLQLADPDLRVHAALFFLDIEATEGAMHALLDKCRVDREHFKVSRAKALALLNGLHGSETAQRTEFTQLCRYMADVGELQLDASGDAQACDGTALATVLAHVPSARDGRNVKTLVPLALNGGHLGQRASALLGKSGLLAYTCDGVVLFDKSEHTSLAKVFKGRPCAITWRAQLAKYAGLRNNAQTLPLDKWLDFTEAEPVLVDRVCPPDFRAHT